MEWEPQGDDFNLSDFIGDTARPYQKKFYCPNCREKMVFNLIYDVDDDNYDCPYCQSIMLLEEE